jgi:hypothetical protein
MIGFDLVEGPPDIANAFMFGCRRRGVHLTYAYGDVAIRIIPPLVITRPEIDFAVQVIEKSLQAARSGDAQDAWPKNPHTRRMLEKRPWQRLVNYLWRSSPAEVAGKGRELIGERLRAGK